MGGPNADFRKMLDQLLHYLAMIHIGEFYGSRFHFMLTAVSLKRLVYTKKRFNPFRRPNVAGLELWQRQ